MHSMLVSTIDGCITRKHHEEAVCQKSKSRSARPVTLPSAKARCTRAANPAASWSGPVPVGGGAPISVQSMTNTLTADVPATLQQIAELTAAGCDIVRVAVPSQDDADALPEIVAKSPIPVIADIHFQSKYVFQAIDAGCAAVRVNPGNIRKFDEVGPRHLQGRHRCGHLPAHRRERRIARQGAVRQIRRPDPGSARRLRA